MPELMSDLWQWFIELHDGRGYGHSGALPLSYTDIKSWSDLTGVKPKPYEIRVIKSIDRVFLDNGND